MSFALKSRRRGSRETEAGQAVYRYADEIFSLGRELLDTMKGGRPATQPMRLAVGVAMVVPKLVAYRILEPALQLPEPVRLECLEDTPGSWRSWPSPVWTWFWPTPPSVPR